MRSSRLGEVEARVRALAARWPVDGDLDAGAKALYDTFLGHAAAAACWVAELKGAVTLEQVPALLREVAVTLAAERAARQAAARAEGEASAQVPATSPGPEALTGDEVGWEARARSDFLDVVEAASEFPPTGGPLEVVTEILADEPAHDCASQSTGAEGASLDSADTSPCGDDEQDLRSPAVQDSETEGREGDTSGPGHDEQDLTGDCGQDSCEEGDQ